MDYRTDSVEQVALRETGREHAGHHFGQVQVQDEARAVLGDVNISRDIHIHVNGDAGVLSAAAAVLKLVHTTDDLREHARRLRALGTTEAPHLLSLSNILEDLAALGRLLKTLASENSAGTMHDTMMGHLVCEALADTVSLERSLNELRLAFRDCGVDVLRRWVEYPQSRTHHPGDISKSPSIGPNPYEWVSQTAVMAKNWANDETQLRTLDKIQKYRAMVITALRTSIDRLVQIPDSDAVNEEIVEVLSMHYDLASDMESLGAIFTTRNGQSTATTSSALGRGVQGSKAPLSLVRYSFHDRIEPTGVTRHPTIESAPNFIEAIKDALYFREESHRRIEIKEAHRKTFAWIFDTNDLSSSSNFTDWLRCGKQCFWISGKAGSGKSTLMKFIHQHKALRPTLAAWAGTRHLIIASYFFWYAGQSLQKSQEGLLRSILRQILEERPDLTPIIFPHLSRSMLRGKSNAETNKLGVQELCEALRLLKEKMPKDLAIFLLIDGVDEYDGRDHLSFSEFLTSIASHPTIKLLVSSRPIPGCNYIFSSSPHLQLQDLTSNDIRAYVSAELLQQQSLREMECLEPGIALHIETALLEKASGVFLWIYLVVRDLRNGLAEYDAKDKMMAKIDALPVELETLFDHMFSKMRLEYQEDGSLLLQLVVRATKAQEFPLSAVQLFVAEKARTDPVQFQFDMEYDPQPEKLRVKWIDGRLRSRCCGLIEVLYRDGPHSLIMPRVDFLHRTVFDYLRENSKWCKATSACKLLPHELDFLLLISVSHVLRRDIQTLCQSRYLTNPGRLTRQLAACMAYSYTMSCQLDRRYTAYMQAVTKVLSTAWTTWVDANVYDVFRRGSVEFANRTALLPPAHDILFKMGYKLPSQMAPMLVFAALPFPDYFEDELRKENIDASNKALLLISLMTIRNSSKLNITLHQIYSRNICALLSHGADPTIATPSALIVPSIFGAAFVLSGVSRPCLLPWNFWLLQPLTIFSDLHITIRLLKVAAPPADYSKRQEVAVKRFLLRLQWYRDRDIWPENSVYLDSRELLPEYEPRCDIS